MRAVPAEFAPAFDRHPFVEQTIATSGDVAARHPAATGQPHILLATTGQLPSTARLAMELHDAGARVSLIAPVNHPARVLDLISNRITYRARSPRRGLEAALRRFQPDMVIPCDERAVRDLHIVCQQTRYPHIKLLIERSTAPAAHFPVITSRAELLSLARRLGVRVPTSMALPDIAALNGWTAQNAAPFVLKADGSWSGFGVRIISNATTAAATYLRMTRRSSGRMALREALLEGDYFGIRSWLRRERPAMSVQRYIDGSPANVGVACYQGEVLAAVCAEAVATISSTGPSTVARIIHNPEMVEASRRVVRELGLSGMIGFDFMIEATTGAAYLIEMNPRNTPICAVRLGPGRDLAEALVARIASRPVRARAPRTRQDIVVFFPDTWLLDPASHLLHSGYHDVPWEEPELVRVLMQPERRERYWVLRLLRRAWLTASTWRANPG